MGCLALIFHAGFGIWHSGTGQENGCRRDSNDKSTHDHLPFRIAVKQCRSEMAASRPQCHSCPGSHRAARFGGLRPAVTLVGRRGHHASILLCATSSASNAMSWRGETNARSPSELPSGERASVRCHAPPSCSAATSADNLCGNESRSHLGSVAVSLTISNDFSG